MTIFDCICTNYASLKDWEGQVWDKLRKGQKWDDFGFGAGWGKQLDEVSDFNGRAWFSCATHSPGGALCVEFNSSRSYSQPS